MLEEGAGGRYLCCRTAVGVAAIPLACVRETLRPLPLEPVAAMPAFMRGLAVIRGAAVPVLDADGLLAGRPGPRSARRWVLLGLGTRAIALAVDDVLDVRALPHARLSELPPLLRDAAADCIAALGTLDAELLVVLESARLLDEALLSAPLGATA